MLELSKDREFIDLIIKLNTQDQLYDKGIDSTGKRLDEIGGGYAPYTIKIKEEKGQPIDRVTLKDTGEFYKTFKVYFSSGELIIIADPHKGDTNLFKEWGFDIVGLTAESKNIVVDMARKKILKIVRREVLQEAA